MKRLQLQQFHPAVSCWMVREKVRGTDPAGGAWLTKVGTARKK